MKTELVVKKGDGMTADLDDLEKGVEAGTTAAPPAAPKEEPVDLLPLFISLNSFFLKHPGFWRFVARYTFLTALQLSFVASITIGTAVVRIDLDDGLDQQKVYVLGGVIAGSYIIAQIAKPFKTGLMAWYRGNGGTELATAIVAKIFDLPLGAITTTPTGELTQLLASCRPILENVIPGMFVHVRAGAGGHQHNITDTI